MVHLREPHLRVLVRSPVSQSHHLLDRLVRSPVSQSRHLRVFAAADQPVVLVERALVATAVVLLEAAAATVLVAARALFLVLVVLLVEAEVVPVEAVVPAVQPDVAHQSVAESVVATAKNFSQ